MGNSKRLGRLAAGVLAMASMISPPQAGATVVEFQTSLGNFSVNLFDQSTPVTVTNFLNYVNNGAYTNSFVHRSVPGFVVQGGGFVYDGSRQFSDVAQNAAVMQNPPITNEPELSNVRGTIAMAKVGGDPDSATSQWYINLADNSANLDAQNGGFTVFGVVTGNGMDIVDAIAALDGFNFGAPFDSLPLRGVPANAGPDETTLVIVDSIVVTDSTVDTSAGLLPPVNTLANPAAPAVPVAQSGGGGGGGGAVLWLLPGTWLLARRRFAAA